MRLYEGWVWAGYHPTYYFREPSTGAKIRLDISDLLVQAVDGAGRPVGAAFSVEGPTPETTIHELYSASGLLNLSQLPMAEYRVRAVNHSEPFSRRVEASGAFRPGQLNRIALPIYQVRLRILDARGSPVEGALVSLAPLTAKSGGDGLAVFEQVPRGSYNLTVRWLNVTVYSTSLSVDSAEELDVRARIYDIGIRITDVEGRQKKIHYILSDPAGRVFEEKYSDYIGVRGVPGGQCLLEVLDPSRGWIILKGSYDCSGLASESELRLPIGRMRLRMLTSDGRPLAFAKVKISFPEWNRTEVLRADGLGEAELMDAKLGIYRVEVVDGQTLSKVYEGEVRFRGEPITIRVGKQFTAVQQAGLEEGPKPGSGPLTEAILIALPIAAIAACALILWRARRRKREEYIEGFVEDVP